MPFCDLVQYASPAYALIRPDGIARPCPWIVRGHGPRIRLRGSGLTTAHPAKQATTKY